MKTICVVPLAWWKAGAVRPVFGLFFLLLAAALSQGADLPGQHSARDSAAAATLGDTARSNASLAVVRHGNGIWMGVSATTIITSGDGVRWLALSRAGSRKPQAVAFE
jgi:hypothetical protein